MDIKKIGYNIGEINITTALTDSTKTEIGTPDDFKKIMTLAKSGGVARLNFKISTTAYSVVVGLNPGTDAVAVGGITSISGDPTAVTGTITLESSKMYATIAVIVVAEASDSSAQQTKTTKSSSK